LKYFLLLITSTFFFNLYAKDISNIAKEFNLYAGTKASIQWERIFSSERRMIKYKIDTLSFKIKNELRIYLINHAADSEQPIVPGL